jgi:protein involved in polysaccharide export with SLBB domain
MRVRRWVAALGLVAAAGCYTTSNHTSQVQTAELEDKKHVLGTGDLVEVRVFREPDLGGTYFVDYQGDIDFPLIGKVRLLGKDPYQVGAEIAHRLAEGYLKQPQVSILVREHNSQKIHVLGEVQRPGSFNYEVGMTVIQAVTNAGGFTKLAATNQVRIARVVSGSEQKYTVPVGDIGKGNAPNFRLQPGDIIYIPEAIF